MLIKFTFKNFLSFKDEITLDMTAEALKEKKAFVHPAYLFNPKLILVKSAAVYGHNSNGKTNFIRAYSFFRRFILNSFSYGRLNDEIEISPFSLNTDTLSRPSKFEIIFLIQNTKYRYGFEATKLGVVSEWLYYSDGPVRENMLFLRVGDEVRNISKMWNKESENRIEQAKLFLKPRALFISLLMEQIDIPRINTIYSWFRGNLVLSGNYSHDVIDAAKIYTNPEYSSAILRFIDEAELGFSSIYHKLSAHVQSGRLREEVADFLFESEKKNFNLYTVHDVYDKDHVLVKKSEFELLKNESSGTIKYFILACYLSYAIKHSQLLLIDELDSSLSGHLLKFLIETYNSSKNNISGSQMIFVCHNSLPLDKKLRRDQIWFVDKNQYGESTLYKAHTAKNPVRINKSIEQDYRSGKTKGTPKKGFNIPTLFDIDYKNTD